MPGRYNLVNKAFNWQQWRCQAAQETLVIACKLQRSEDAQWESQIASRTSGFNGPNNRLKYPSK